MKHIELVLFQLFVGSEMLLKAGFHARECLPYCIIKKMEEFCNNYKGCPCFACKKNYFYYNKDVEEEFKLSCLVPFMEHYQFKEPRTNQMENRSRSNQLVFTYVVAYDLLNKRCNL